MNKIMKGMLICSLLLIIFTMSTSVVSAKKVKVISKKTDITKIKADRYYKNIYIGEHYKGRLRDINTVYLKKVTVSKNNKKYKSVKGVVFSKNGKTLLLYPKDKRGNYKIPSTVKIIAAKSFRGYKGKKISIPSTVKYIKSYAFGESSLEEVKIPKSISVIKEKTFFRCKSLKKVSIPKKTTKIERRAFRECSVLTKINLNSVKNIENYAFKGCSKLKDIDLLNVKKIGSEAFWKTGITEVSVKDDMKILSAAFPFEATVKYNCDFAKIKPILPGGKAWNTIFGADGYETEIIITNIIETDKFEMREEVNKPIMSEQMLYKIDERIKSAGDITYYPIIRRRIRGYKVLNGNKIYTEWSNYFKGYYEIDGNGKAAI